MSLNRFIKQRILSPWLVTWRLPAAAGRVAFTFDDGPHPQVTTEVLAVLKRHGARATFFCVGDNIEHHRDLACDIIAQGHEIGNHSMSHPEIGRLPFRELSSEVTAFAGLGSELGGAFNPRLFRPPKGVLNINILLFSLLHGLRLVLWSRDPEDFRAGSVDEILHHFADHPLQAGDIVLMHDKNPHTPVALNALLEDCGRRGLQAVTVSELRARGAGR